MAVSRNIYPDGPLLKEKSKQIANHLRYTNDSYSVSNVWLELWKKRHNVKQVVVNGTARGETVSTWKERLSEITNGHYVKDIWSLDNTDYYKRALFEKGFGQKGKECKGG